MCSDYANKCISIYYIFKKFSRLLITFMGKIREKTCVHRVCNSRLVNALTRNAPKIHLPSFINYTGGYYYTKLSFHFGWMTGWMLLNCFLFFCYYQGKTCPLWNIFTNPLLYFSYLASQPQTSIYILGISQHKLEEKLWWHRFFMQRTPKSEAYCRLHMYSEKTPFTSVIPGSLLALKCTKRAMTDQLYLS